MALEHGAGVVGADTDGIGAAAQAGRGGMGLCSMVAQERGARASSGVDFCGRRVGTGKHGAAATLKQGGVASGGAWLGYTVRWLRYGEVGAGG